MKEFKGTIGSWEVIEHSWSDTSVYSGDTLIATKSIYEDATEETRDLLESEVSANFNLISSAPDLLFALQEITAHLDSIKQYSNDDYYINQAQLAITKALGE